MSRLYRPHIPLEIKCVVAVRQLLRGQPFNAKLCRAVLLRHHDGETLKDRLERLLTMLADRLGCARNHLHLDHDPPLAARKRTGDGKQTVYDPPANDPEHLIYREKHAHHIKTNVRGDGAQYPDRVLIKRERHRTKKAKPKRKGKWGARPLQSANRWPPKGSRKLGAKPWPKSRQSRGPTRRSIPG